MAEIFDKKIIQKNFSTGAKTYDEAASLQLLAANDLCRIVEESGFFLEQKKRRILDLGSGTSFIAQNFFQKKNLEIFEIDLVLEMLKQWNQRPDKIFPVQADSEKIPFKDNVFDLVISSFSLQWLTDFTAGFSEIFQLLRPNGFFAFCLPIEGSLAELRKASVNSGCNFYFKPLPEIEDLSLAIKKSGFVEIFSKKALFEKSFAGGIAALQSLKKLGANFSIKTENHLTKSHLKKFDSLFLEGIGEAKISYETIFFLLKKPDLRND